MNYKILLSPRVAKDLRKIDRATATQVDKKFLALARNPYLPGAKQLQDSKLAQFRIRVGDYRIIV